MVPKENSPSPKSPTKTRVAGALRTVTRFFLHTLGVRFLLALVSAFALWWYVVPDGSGSTNNTSNLTTGYYRTVSVLPQIQGNPADGYGVTTVLVAPPTITIQGPVPGLGDANSINTKSIDITDATRTLTRVVGLDLPIGVSSTTISTVTVSIYIAPLQGKVSSTVPVTFKNLAPNLTGSVDPGKVTVTLQGPLPELNTVEIQPVVDVSGLGLGSYVLPVQVSAPGDVGVQITPADVTVTLSLAPTPTPTPPA